MKTERSVGFVSIPILLLSVFDLLKDGCQNHNKFFTQILILIYHFFFFSLARARRGRARFKRIQMVMFGTVPMAATMILILTSFLFPE